SIVNRYVLPDTWSAWMPSCTRPAASVNRTTTDETPETSSVTRNETVTDVGLHGDSVRVGLEGVISLICGGCLSQTAVVKPGRPLPGAGNCEVLPSLST